MHEKYQLISIEELGNATWGRLVFMIYVLHWVSEGSLIQTQKYIGQDLGMKSPWEFPQKPWRLSNKGRSNWKVSNVTSGLTVPSSETHSSPLMQSSQYKKKKKRKKERKIKQYKNTYSSGLMAFTRSPFIALKSYCPVDGANTSSNSGCIWNKKL